MKNRGLLIFGGVLILLGILSLIENIFHIDFGAYFFPLILIGIGVWLLVRPRLEAPGRLRFIGDMNRSGPWEVTEEEHTVFVGDTRMDFTQATLPEGETRIVLNGFVGDIRVIVPRDMAVRLLCHGFTHPIHWFGRRQHRAGLRTGSPPPVPGCELFRHHGAPEVPGLAGCLCARIAAACPAFT